MEGKERKSERERKIAERRERTYLHTAVTVSHSQWSFVAAITVGKEIILP